MPERAALEARAVEARELETIRPAALVLLILEVVAVAQGLWVLPVARAGLAVPVL